MIIRLLMKWLPAAFLALTPPIASSAAGDMEFDRFFTDKKTRMQLNQAREQHRFISPRGSAAVDEAQELILPDVKFDGMIIREDGSTEVWVNSTAETRNDLTDQIEVKARRTNDGRVRITLPSGRTVKLKPGQVYSMETEHVREVYEEADETPVVESEGKEKPENAEVQEKAQTEEKTEAAFDEEALAEDQDAKVRLLEERVQKLERASSDGS